MFALKVTDVEVENCLVGIQWLQFRTSDVFFFLFFDASQYTCCLHSVLTALLSICDISGGNRKACFCLWSSRPYMSALCAQHVSPNEKLNTLNKKYEEPFGAIDFPSIAANILAFVRAGFLIRHMQESVFVE